MKKTNTTPEMLEVTPVIVETERNGKRFIVELRPEVIVVRTRGHATTHEMPEGIYPDIMALLADVTDEHRLHKAIAHAGDIYPAEYN